MHTHSLSHYICIHTETYRVSIFMFMILPVAVTYTTYTTAVNWCCQILGKRRGVSLSPDVEMIENDSSDELQARMSPNSWGAHCMLFTRRGIEGEGWRGREVGAGREREREREREKDGGEDR